MRFWLEMTCEVPVFPQTSCPSIRARPPVPAPLTTPHMPCRIASSFSGVTSTFDWGGGGGTGLSPVPSSIALTRWGVMRVPPLAIVAAYTAIDTGVTDTCPWPIETEIVSPAYHFSCIFSSFHWVEGTRPCSSLGRSMFDLTPRPKSVAHLLIL